MGLSIGQRSAEVIADQEIGIAASRNREAADGMGRGWLLAGLPAGPGRVRVVASIY
jgi:hypothetical protein